jgi:Fur family zinc uptake transcriptional regulator
MPEKRSRDAVPDCLTEAENLCRQKGVRLTGLRRSILKILASSDGPVKAYGIIEHMREHGQRVTPATIYRTLDFLLQNGLIHRVNSLNAYIHCTVRHESHALLVFVCAECRKTTEIDDEILHDSMRNRLNELGLSMHDSCIEIQGTCKRCMK